MTNDTMKVAYKVEALGPDGRVITTEVTELGGSVEIEDVFDHAVKHDIDRYRVTAVEVKTDMVHIKADE